MNGGERRNLIIAKLEKATAPICATKLADEFSVTRQIIVADIALLRAAGHAIRAEHRGYVLGARDKEYGIVKRVVVKHGQECVREELYAVVDNGGKLVDVIVEHAIYGMISASLNIETRYDADKFLEKVEAEGVSPLSALTKGVHVHTIAVKTEEAFERIVQKLSDLGVYIESN